MKPYEQSDLEHMVKAPSQYDGTCRRLADELMKAREHRDEYKRAWQRDMEKGREFLAERDAARAEVERLTVENERLEALFQQTNGMRCHSSWVAKAQRLQGALEAIAEYAMDWTVGADANLARVQAMAETALRPPEAYPTSTPAKHECPSCDLDDSVEIPAGKLLASTPIRKPGAPIGEARPTDLSFDLAAAIRKRMAAPPDTGVRPGLRPAIATALHTWEGDPLVDSLLRVFEADRRSR
jgi:hypothetical protein